MKNEPTNLYKQRNIRSIDREMMESSIPTDRPTKSFYDDKYRTGQEIFRTNKKYALECLPRGTSLHVLDVGCGTGLNSEIIASLGHKVVGIDISEEAIKRYRERGFEGYVMDVEKHLNFSKEKFDVVFTTEVIEHLVHPENMFREIWSVLKPEGKLILSTVNSAFWLYRLASLVGITVSELQHPMHLRFFSKCSLIRLIKEQDFEPIRVFGRNIYIILPDLKFRLWRVLLSLLGFREETRFVTGKKFWHLSNKSRILNGFFADTLIVVAKKKS